FSTILLTNLPNWTYFSVYYPSLHAPPRLLSSHAVTANPLTRRHLLFSIASSSSSWPRCRSYVRLWYSSNSARALTFLDRAADSSSASDPTFPKGLRSAVHVARVVKEAVDLTDEKAGIRWFVFGDGNAVSFVDNLVKTLSKYGDDRWFYVGSNSEGYEQNAKHSFDMTFGGGGFAISHRWFYVGSNSEGYEQNAKHSFDMTFGGGGFALLVEVGVGLNPEPSFHQKQALQHLFKAVNVDPAGILQQTVCYDESSLLTVSVAWGYAIEVYEGNQLLPDLLSLWRTFTSWRRGSNVESHFMFNLRDYPSDPFKRPIVFFLESVLSDNNSMQSNYVKHVVGNCARADLVRKMEKIRVFSEKLELDVEE
ncbi:hypothetical protein CICLE_v10017986mg, partial [Citrus x clementina]